MTEKLRVGVIGCGAIAQIMHVPYLKDYDDHFELMALADSDPGVLNAVADQHHVKGRYTDWQDMIARDDIDAVIIAHSGSHYETLVACVQAGKHVLCEKPLAWNAREATALGEQLKDVKTVIQLAYHKMYDPAFQVARDEIAKIDDLGFGRITVLHPANELGFSPFRLRRGNGMVEEGHADVGTWEAQRSGQLRAFAGGRLSPLVDEALGPDRKDDERLRLGYGIITVSLIHQIYMLHGLVGSPKRVVRTDIWRDGFSIQAQVEYNDAFRVTMDWHFLSHLKDYREEYLFAGNHNRVRLEFPGPYFRNFPSPVTIQGHDGELAWEKQMIVSLDEAFRNELLAFHDCVVNGTPVRTPLSMGIEHIQFVQKLIDAAE